MLPPDKVEVRFDRRTCIHSGVCLASLPEVFDLDRRPWIQPENADSEKLLEAVALCPSGALQARKLM